MRIRTYLSCVALLACTSVFAQCLDEAGRAASATGRNPATAAAEKTASRMATLKTREQVTAYMKLNTSDANPILQLPPAARAGFLDSLTFNEHGLTGYEYTELENRLTPTQIFRILSLFGAQRNTAMFKKATIRTAKDRQLLQGAAVDADCEDPTGPGDGDDPYGDGTGGEGGGDGGYDDGGYPGGYDPAAPAYPPGPSTPQDYSDYSCRSPGNCKASRGRICLKTC